MLSPTHYVLTRRPLNLTMATKAQIEANRRNGLRSRGPRSLCGKKRASRNALRHGLARKNSSACFLVALEKLACRIAGDCPTPTVLEYARAAAEAKLEIGRVRRAKASLIQRVRALGALVPAKHFLSLMHEIRWCQAMYLWSSGLRPTKPPDAIAIDPLTSMPLTE